MMHLASAQQQLGCSTACMRSTPVGGRRADPCQPNATRWKHGFSCMRCTLEARQRQRQRGRNRAPIAVGGSSPASQGQEAPKAPEPSTIRLTSLTQGAASRLPWQRPDVHVVLVHPQIPQNAGNVARTCAATGVALHLVAPLGFRVDDKQLKRAGLDYWHSVAVHVHASWQEFYSWWDALPAVGGKRLVAFSVFGDTYYAGPEFEYRPGDWLVFGAETSGLPPEAHADVAGSGGALVQVPILATHVRSINLAVCAGVGLFEALRQLDAGRHHVEPRSQPGLGFIDTMAKYHQPLLQSGAPPEKG